MYTFAISARFTKKDMVWDGFTRKFDSFGQVHQAAGEVVEAILVNHDKAYGDLVSIDVKYQISK